MIRSTEAGRPDPLRASADRLDRHPAQGIPAPRHGPSPYHRGRMRHRPCDRCWAPPRRVYAGRVMDRSPPALLRRPIAADLAMTAALAGLALGLGWSMIAKFGGNWKLIYALGSAAAWHRLLIAWWLATAVGLAALPLRRRFPLAVFGATLAMAAVHYSDPVFGLSPADLAVPIALYSLAAAAPRRISLSALGGGIALATIASALIGSSLGAGWLEQPSYIIASGLALAAAWFAGDGSRTRRAYLAEVERRASDAERDRDRQAELAV